MFLELSSIFGLPAHPLVVHAAVVLIPLGVIAFAAVCWRPSWRLRYGIPAAAIAVAGAAAAWLAEQTGEPLEDRVRHAARLAGVNARIGDHPEQGEFAFVWAAVFAGLAVLFVLLIAFRARLRLPAWAGHAAFAVALIPGVVALVAVIIAGHSGAELVWEDVGSFATGR